MTTTYVLKTSICGFRKGTLVYYDDVWGDWEINGQIYNFRGSIGEGEIIMLFDSLRNLKLNTILQEAA